MSPNPFRLQYIGEVDPEDPEGEAIREADRICFPADDPPSFVGVHWWIVGERDRPGAYAGVRRSYNYSDCAYLSRVGVLPGYRGQGLQRRLIRARVRWAKREGLYGICSDTTDNWRSANNLIREGFELFEPLRPWGDSETLYWFKRLLVCANDSRAA